MNAGRLIDTECLVVCVGPSPGSERLVRATHRLAESMNARWYAVHVSLAAAAPLSPADRDRVEGHLELAESLGADISYLVGRSIADSVLDYARELLRCPKLREELADRSARDR